MAIDIKNVSKSFVTKHKDETLNVLKDVNLHVDDNELICILGPSGCGKTTLIRIVAGLEEATDVRNIQIAFRKLRDIVGTKNPRDVLKSYKNKLSSQIEKEMRNFILKNGYTSMEKVKNGILSNDQKMREWLNLSEPEDEIQRKKQGASSFDIENVRKVYPDFQIRMSEDQTENFRIFLKNYVHIKKDVRNSVNHASADTKVQKLTPENITKDLRYGLDALKKCMDRKRTAQSAINTATLLTNKK